MLLQLLNTFSTNLLQFILSSFLNISYVRVPHFASQLYTILTIGYLCSLRPDEVSQVSQSSVVHKQVLRQCLLGSD